MRILKWLPIALAFSCDSPVAPSPSPRAPASEPWADKLLASASGSADGVRGVKPIVSPNAEIAAFEISGRGSYYIIGETRTEIFDSVQDASFSPDGRLAFLASRGKDVYVIVGGHKEGPFSWAGQVAFSPDGRRVAYGAATGEKQFVVSDGKRGEEFDQVGEIVFSTDGASLAHIAWNGNRCFWVQDGRRGEEFEGLNSLGFVGSEPIAAAKKNGRWTVVKGGSRSEEFDRIDHLRISANRHAYAFAAAQDGQWNMISQSQKGEGFDGIGPPVLSADGLRMAYFAQSSGKGILMVDGRRIEQGRSPAFSPDGKTFAYVEGEAFKAKATVVIGDTRGETFTDVLGEIQFSPRGAAAYVGVVESKKAALVVGEQKIELSFHPIPDCHGTFIHFSPDGSRVAVIEAGGQEIWRRVFDVQ